MVSHCQAPAATIARPHGSVGTETVGHLSHLNGRHSTAPVLIQITGNRPQLIEGVVREMDSCHHGCLSLSHAPRHHDVMTQVDPPARVGSNGNHTSDQEEGKNANMAMI